MSPATAADAALASAQGFARVVQPVVAVPVGDTYSVAAPAGHARVSAATSAEHEPSTIFMGMTHEFPPPENLIPLVVPDAFGGTVT